MKLAIAATLGLILVLTTPITKISSYSIRKSSNYKFKVRIKVQAILLKQSKILILSQRRIVIKRPLLRETVIQTKAKAAFQANSNNNNNNNKIINQAANIFLSIINSLDLIVDLQAI